MSRRISLASIALLTALAGAAGADPWDEPNATDDNALTKSELAHGSDELHDLAAVGGIQDEDWFRLRQAAYSSYEIVIDSPTGDIGNVGFTRVFSTPPHSMIQSAVGIGFGPVRSLRFQNTTASAITNQMIRVFGAACTTTCLAKDVYRIRAFETTLRIPRFNNSATMVSTLLLANPTDTTVAVTVRAWNTSGASIGSMALSLAPRAQLVMPISNLIPGSSSGSLTISNDARYGELTAVVAAMEPATGFSWTCEASYRGY